MTTIIKRYTIAQPMLLLGILLIATNLRAPITGLAPVLPQIRTDLGLSTVQAGALTTLPLMVFAIVSPFSAMLAREYGLERTLFAALAAIAAGIALRSSGGTLCLYAGVGIIGVGIAITNVLLPSLVKRDYPDKVAALTGAYALATGAVAALGSAVVIALTQAWGWRIALALFVVLPAAAGALWVFQISGHTAPAPGTATPPHGRPVWHAALAWQVSLYLGLNSTIYYVAIGWLPTILSDAGVSASQAGSLHGVLQLATAVPGIVLGPILRRMRDQRLPAVVTSLLAAIALVGLLVTPHLALVWAVLFGLGTGASFILGLAFIGLRTSNASQAAALSGMAQCAGYLLAAVGPMTMGVLHDLVAGWALPLAICAVLAVAMAWFGALAGRNIHIANEP